MAYFNKEIEVSSLSALQELQLERMKKLVKRISERIPFYREIFDSQKINAENFSTLSDLQYLPFTYKSALRENYPFSLFAVPLPEVKELHASTGTTGKMTVVGYTSQDIKLWSEVMARSLVCAGVTKGDVIQNAYGYGLFTGGLGVHYGALELGATVIPISAGGTQRQLAVLNDFGTTVLTCTPSYSLFMAEEAKEVGFNPDRTNLKVGVFGAEPWTEGMREQIEKEWNILALDIYGLSEIIGPGVAMECVGKEGLHIWADHFFPEIINPENGQVLGEGEEGELVITTLTKEALPLLRYRTGDIVSLIQEPCQHCGRTMPRISKIKGRIDDMLIIRGVNIFPSQIETVLMNIPEVAPHYQLIITKEKHLDKMEVQVEVNENIFSDKIRKLEILEKKMVSEIENILGISVKVKLVEPKSIQRSEGKAKRVIDKRYL